VGRKVEKAERAFLVATNNGATYTLSIIAAVVLVVIWFVNVPGMQVASKLITALTPSSLGVKGNIATFEDLVAHPSFAAQEIREQLVAFAGQVVQNSQATIEEKQQAATLAINEMRKQVEAYPLDARGRLQLSYIYRTIGDPKSALAEVLAAAELSPNKETIWIEAGATAWDLGDVKAAQEYFNTAYALGPQFQALAPYAAAGNIVAGDQATADRILRDAYGTINVDSNILVVAYYRIQNWPRLITLLKQRTMMPGANVDAWFSLAAAYYQSGDKANAIRAVNDAVTLYPDAAASGAAAIKESEGT
ncbi:MAG: tetratricopeptide repeat protein, partial [bacterium]|nr:tetratricopeptide repeat protein [bacterium]